MLNKTRLSRQLRRNATDAEQHLWYHLRAGRLLDYKFRRQVPLGPYIVDFACLAQRLVIELDGSQHLDSLGDQVRDAWLTARGLRVLRFWNHEVLSNTEAVLEAIMLALAEEQP